MIESLGFLVACILSFLITSPDLISNKLEQARNYFNQSTTQRCSADQEFQSYLQAGHYQHCIELIKHAKKTPTKLDLNQATQLASLETDPNRKKDAQCCVRFIYHALVDNRVIIPSKETTRTIEDLMSEMQRDLQGPQYHFLQAIRANNCPQIRQLLRQGANPHLSSNYMQPIEHAIACGNIDAVRILYNEAAVTPTIEHLERANIIHFLWTSNQAEPISDIIFTNTDQATGYARELQRYAELCSFIASKLDQQPPQRPVRH